MRITDDLITAVRSTAPDDERQWFEITNALEAIANQLSAWGELLTRINALPDLATVEEVAAGLSAVDPQLRALDGWLEERAQPHWRNLQEMLRRALQSYRRSSTRESLSVYLRFRAGEPLARRGAIEQALRCERERFRAGDGMIELGEALRGALRLAKAVY